MTTLIVGEMIDYYCEQIKRMLSKIINSEMLPAQRIQRMKLSGLTESIVDFG